MKNTFFVYNTPLGRVTIASDGTSITRLGFGPCAFEGEYRATRLTNDAANQIQEYLAGKRQVFDLPLNPSGSDFQKRVWDALLAIPYGQTRSYKDIATQLGNPKALRAVGGANNKNPIPIIIPCHRVIGVRGDLVGYAASLRIKAFLLELEAKNI